MNGTLKPLGPARLRVGEEVWNTVGSSTNVIEASWRALADSLEYWLLKQARTTGDIPLP